ncbi:glycosyltransferase [Ruminococcus albus]|uniref:glycosyltransferase n=1 Tax=Ruminococcus albus TaxID=1264 RepID=UPI0004AD8D21|nr:glycosyltransferase [Ruminococcus albus]
MKILMINVVCGIRSTGRICTDLADALTEQGHTVKIAYGRETVPEKYQKYAIRIGNDLDVKLHGVRARLLDECGFGSKRATIKFIEWVKKYDPDVIHLHNIHGYYINVEVLFDYLRSCGKKIIWTLHDCWAFTGHSALCDGINCEKWEKGCSNCPNLKEYPKSLFDYSKNNWIKKEKFFSGYQT